MQSTHPGSNKNNKREKRPPGQQKCDESVQPEIRAVHIDIFPLNGGRTGNKRMVMKILVCSGELYRKSIWRDRHAAQGNVRCRGRPPGRTVTTAARCVHFRIVCGDVERRPVRAKRYSGCIRSLVLVEIWKLLR